MLPKDLIPEGACRIPATALSASVAGGLCAVVLTVGLAGCGNTDSWVDASAAQGWPAQYGDAANSSYTATGGATKLTLRWTRSVKGSLAAGPALSSRGWLALNAQTPAGCSLMEWENNDNGRQRWCVRLFQGGGFAGPLFDGFDNLYVGQPGAITVVSADAVDALAPAGDRNALHPKVSRARSTAGRHAPGTGAGFRRPSRRGGRQFGGSGGRRRSRPMRPAGCPIARRPGRAARSRPHPPSRRRAGRWCWASGSRAPRPRGWSG